MRFLPLLLLISACRGYLDYTKPDGSVPADDTDTLVDPPDTVVDTDLPDQDADGTPDAEDCAPTNADVHPGAVEHPYNGVDDDCDSATPDDDLDGDGFVLAVDCVDDDATRNPGEPEVAYTGVDEDCDPATPDDDLDADGALVATDCDDENAGVRPGAIEVCDGLDQDCDGLIDDAAGLSWFVDSDGDGYGDPGTTVAACTPGLGLVDDSTDCDDATFDVHPGALERCDGRDDDCNGAIDDNAIDGLDWHDDLDGDGWGSSAVAANACTAPAGLLADGTDCADGVASIHPNADERCNGVDDDCDAIIDDNPVDPVTFYADRDGDSWGLSPVTACTLPADAAARTGDCDDGRYDVNPGAAELCGGVDEDCDGQTDEAGAVGESAWHADVDGDRYGDAAATSACVAPPGAVADGTDCDDAVPAVFPGAVELCDGLDNDCDGAVDEGAVNDGTFYADVDGDGWGDSASTLVTCTPPAGWVASPGDCADGDPTRNPGATELCDGADQDCDGLVDDGASGVDWFLDSDRDGAGDAGFVVSACAAPPGSWSSTDDDCDDRNGQVFPGAPETCNGVDDDCDARIDDDPTNPGSWYGDGDGDGYGAGAAIAACTPPVGAVSTNTDCDDTLVAVHPGAPETCDGTDEDCDGLIDESASGAPSWNLDADGDGFGSASTTTGCTAPAGYVGDASDCDDRDRNTYPGAPETCDGADEDCDALIDDNAVGAPIWFIDGDADGYGGPSSVSACTAPAGTIRTSTDCDDAAFTIHPRAAELCDGVDQDCDGLIDDGVAGAAVWHLDADGDGFGGAITASGCSAPAGYLADGSDCDDGARGTFPGAPETCDGVDQDCDSVIDNDPVGAPTYFVDGDGDGFGGASPVRACTQPANATASSTDCDDTAAAVFPGAVETCNGVDDDCDRAADEAPVVGAPTWHQDADRDGFGGPATTEACTAPAGFLADATDCDDGLRIVYPGAPELCDGMDDDCDGQIDEGAVGNATWYADPDGDDYGAGPGISSCTPPVDAVLVDGDCGPADALIHPGAGERCNGVDDDCDGQIDEGDVGVGPVWHRDGDLDGYGSATDTVQRCSQPAGYTADSSDCDDGDRAVHPGATETCDGRDSDCDGAIDDSPTGAPSWYTDADADGYGAGAAIAACVQPAGAVATRTDCNDAAASISPGAAELCNGVDDDCDGQIDEGSVASGPVWHRDGDRDGSGDPLDTVQQCAQPAGYVSDGSDCDDGDRSVRPGAPETCDGVDEDCDLSIDEGAVDAPSWYGDGDADGFGAGVATRACTQPGGTVLSASDCDDAFASIFPGAPERCNSVDDDCDSQIDEGAAVDGATWYRDLDGDSYGDATSTAISCAQPAGYTDDPLDCDDRRASASPVAVELCNGLDDDCDTLVDDNATDPGSWYLDLDSDGWGTGAAIVTCTPPGGAVAQRGDCNDVRPDVFPGAVELCDGVDQDCDGRADDNAADASIWYLDSDLDGHGTAAVTTAACTQPPAFDDDDLDCNDLDALDGPGMTERCDGRDNDCDGQVDEAGATGEVAWRPDGDGDGWGTGVARSACVAPAGYGQPGDCNDADAGIHPTAPERCDGVDQDCDGLIDDNATDTSLAFLDRDGDGFGLASVSLAACTPPAGYAAASGDCDDAVAAINPSAVERCNGVDDDCDGVVDFAGAPDARDWFFDGDCDTQGDAATVQRACFAPGAGWVTSSTDCDDSDARTRTGGVELCDGEDDDCDGVVDDGCVNAVQIGPSSYDSPGVVSTPGACGRFAETSSGLDPHNIGNMGSFLSILDGTAAGRLVYTDAPVSTLDYSTRCGSNHLASPGNFPSTVPWPALSEVGNLGVARIRGFLHIGCGEPTERTIGLIGNDSVRLKIEGTTILEQDWNSGRWKKFRWVTFPGPGLYAFEIDWDTNFVCDIDPMELVWSNSFLAGYQTYDTMCASSSCGIYGNGVQIPGFRVVTGAELAYSMDGGAGTCTPCSSGASCASGVCNRAGLCE